MQKPLKRFTQCGSLTVLFTVFVILFSLSSSALTTFGINKSNSNSNNNSPPPTPIPKGKECSSNTDCNLIPETTCVRDYDFKSRCLCGNYLAPRNGRCDNVPKGVRHRCRDDDECDDNMICRENNSTNKNNLVASFGKNAMAKEKICLCDEDRGYMENVLDKHCNGAMRNFMAGIFGYVAAIIFYFTVTQKILTY